MNESGRSQNHLSDIVQDVSALSGTQASDGTVNCEPVERLISTSEAARVAGVDSRTIRRWFASGKIRGKQDGHKLFVYLDDIEDMSGTMDDFSPGQGADISGIDVLVPEMSGASRDFSGTSRDALIERLTTQLVAAASRVSWLECELGQHKEELLLLPDLQSKATALEEVRTENEFLKKQVQEIELQLLQERNNWWKRFWTWMGGGRAE